MSLSSLRESFAQTVCQHCLPAAEAQRDGLLQSVSELLQSMGDLEAELIRCLSESLGENLLEDAALLANVESCRVSSELVAKQLATAESAALALSSTRASLLPVADVCVSMFTALSSLRALNPMYEHSMAWFQWLLSDSLDATLDGTASDAQPQLLAFTTFRRDWESSHPDIDPSLRNSMVQSLRLLSERLVEAVTAGLYQEHRQIAAILLFASLHSSLCHLTPAVAAVWETILGRTPFTEDVHT